MQLLIVKPLCNLVAVGMPKTSFPALKYSLIYNQNEASFKYYARGSNILEKII